MKNDQEKKEQNRWFLIIAVVFFLIALILTVGLISKAFKEPKNELTEEEKEQQREETRQRELLTLKAKLAQIENEIKALDGKINKIISHEKNVLLAARICVGLILIAADLIYYYTGEEKEILTDLLKFNSAIVAVYSFVAFISHGTPSKFAAYLKKGVKKIFHWFHRKTHQNFIALKQNRKDFQDIILVLEAPPAPVVIEQQPLEPQKINSYGI